MICSPRIPAFGLVLLLGLAVTASGCRRPSDEAPPEPIVAVLPPASAQAGDPTAASENGTPPSADASTSGRRGPRRGGNTPQTADSPIKPEEAIDTISPQAAAAYLDREVYVVGRVARTDSRTGHVFLNFDRQDRDALTIFIDRQNVGNFPEPPDKLYRGKLIRVHGFVYEFKGKPNLSARGPEEITILPDDAPLPPPGPVTTAAAEPWSLPADGIVTLATYNILNLFDAFDDPYSADSAGESKPRAQLEALARGIRGLNADVLALEEVENRGYLQWFNSAFLRSMGYEAVLFEGNDNRGIDVAVLSRIPVGRVTSHRHLSFPDGAGRPSRLRRDLLEVQLLPPGGVPFEVFVVHLKSKGGEPSGGADTRIGEARAIRRQLDARLQADPQVCFVVCGDFNDTIDSEPVQLILGQGPAALKSFVEELPADGRVSFNQPPFLSMIDFIFASPAMAARYAPGSYRIVSGGSPETTGSDHNPLVARFRVK
jgi:endonuclease/exonuclease/phosphatase family metal-dependent hydrolase